MLQDSFLRKHNYLRVSITDKCNLRCQYCMPPEGVKLLTHDQILRNEEFIHLVNLFISMGITKVRFTGGEPLIRKGFIDIVKEISKKNPDIELCLTTNGILLNNFIEDLKKFQVNRLNVSLDSLSRERFKTITGKDCLNDVIDNIEKAVSVDQFKVKVNAVLFGETLNELDDFLEYFKDKNIALRFIERMPFTSEDETQSFIPSDKLISALEEKGDLKRNDTKDTSVANMYMLNYKKKYSIKIGIIPPMTHKFCSSCNRLRLTSNGLLKTCLYSENDYDIKTPLRQNISDEKLKSIIVNAVTSKKVGHNIECYSDDTGCHSIIKNSMSKIGG